MSLKAAGLIAGIFLLLISIPSIVKSERLRALAPRFPRSREAGIALLTVDLLWSFWLLATMEMGEFSSFRRPLLFILPVSYFLVIRFVDEFLAVRALGILFLLAGEPLVDAAFFRYETSRLLVTVFAYLLIILGLFWVTMPYLMRDQIDWSARTSSRWRLANGMALIYGIALLALALTRY